MNRRKLIIGSVIGLGALVAAVPLVWSQVALAHGGRGGGCAMRTARAFGHFREMTRDLNLTDEQKNQIHAIAMRTREQNVATHDALKDSLTDAAQVLLADPSNVAGARAVLDQNAPTIDQVKSSLLTGFADAMKVLTPEQRQLLAARLAQHHD